MPIVLMPSPVGPLRIVSDDNGRLIGLDFDTQPFDPRAHVLPSNPTADLSSSQAVADHPVVAQLAAYFAGSRERFELEYAFVGGTPFQRQVWQRIAEIPFGETITYGELAADIGRPKASRPVGAACGQNPISIVVPCHRVMGAGGRLTGFGGGIERKSWLLNFECCQPRLWD